MNRQTSGIKPNARTYTILMGAVVRARPDRQVILCLDLFREALSQVRLHVGRFGGRILSLESHPPPRAWWRTVFSVMPFSEHLATMLLGQ
jgi:hypothetical protein